MPPKYLHLNTPILGVMAACLACYVALAMPRKEHRLKYKGGDWEDHFGYHPGHYASDHQWRYKNANLTRPPKIVSPEGAPGSLNQTIPLKEYVVRVMNDNKVQCSGIILDPEHVLTVSTCTGDLAIENLKIKLFDGTKRKVVNSSVAPSFGVDEGQQLLVLLELDEELDRRYNSAPPICSRQVKPSANVQLWYWDKRHIEIKTKKVNQMREETCKGVLNDHEGKVVTNATSCLHNTMYTKKCMKSFGLPYVWMNNFCGLNLLGHNCPKALSADLYVRLLDSKRFVADKLRAVYYSGLESEII